MVDFSKRLGKKPVEKPLEPSVIYDRLDRASDKGELRSSQAFILDAWHKLHRNERDVIIKLHTGQGKTLIGLLLLQSKLNEGKGPALYLCPTIQLVEQTCDQARQFGIGVVSLGEDDWELPPEFMEGRAIFVTTAAKLFNGKTKFGLAGKSLQAGAVLLDDSHACVDAIRDAVSVKIPAKLKTSSSESTANPLYLKLLDFFTPDLQSQGAGTYQDIKSGSRDALLPIPYWAWQDRANDVTAILAGYSETQLKFAWPILKDRITDCLCLVSGHAIEIVPYLPPLDMFGTYWNAPHRVFMSATVTDDSFLIKGLRLSRKTILSPLVYPAEKWSGEKMILIPSLIHDDLDRSTVVNFFGPPNMQRTYGQVALAPFFSRTKDWEGCGARVVKTSNIDSILNDLKKGFRNQTIVFASRYDGIDLPDDLCRVLIFDSLPYGESLYDRYTEQCRPGSRLQNIRLARSIEQGLGRSVRGEKDYSVIVIIGPELVDFLRQSHTRAFLSEQTRKQVEIGIEVSAAAKEEANQTTPGTEVLASVAQQCLKRDEGWKEFYRREMDSISPKAPTPRGLEAFEAELLAEIKYESRDAAGAIQLLQSFMDKGSVSPAEKAFYVQEMARYAFSWRKSESSRLQIESHSQNRMLLRPTEGTHVQQLSPLAGARIGNIIKWVKSFETFENLKVAVDELCSRLTFGTAANDFERAVQQAGQALGFNSERPEKEWKAGPDNLWCLRDGDYLLIECKSEVLETRSEINKHEVGQMNTAIAWFKKNYQQSQFTRIMIIPTSKVGPASVFSDAVGIMRGAELGRLRKRLRAFFNEFGTYDFKSLDEEQVNAWLTHHKLSIDDIKAEYKKEVYAASQ
ncbi:MAG TPA: DEAD/DEAH box helicase [Opitutaceae bacterium]|nr:DEAD/DEAH box helicase [Opitutaceae bacterium]